MDFPGCDSIFNAPAVAAMTNRGLSPVSPVPGFGDRAESLAEALSFLSSAHEADPQDQEIAGNLGLALFDADNPVEAEIAPMDALLIDPARVGAWTVLGMVFARQGHQRSALGAFPNAYRFSKDQAKTGGYFTKLAETDRRASIREAAAEPMRQVGL